MPLPHGVEIWLESGTKLGACDCMELNSGSRTELGNCRQKSCPLGSREPEFCYTVLLVVRWTTKWARWNVSMHQIHPVGYIFDTLDVEYFHGSFCMMP